MKLRNLSTGTIGPDVKAIQEALNTGGVRPVLDTDGKFGNRTDTAVRKFQSAHFLKPDGIVGPRTRRALFPVGVATTTVYGMRLRMPDFSLPGPRIKPPSLLPSGLRLDLGWNSQICRGLSCLIFPPLRLPRLRSLLPAPAVPDWNFSIPPLPGQSPSLPLGFVYGHVELQPGAQSTFPFGGQRQDAFVLTMQNVYRRGPDTGPHLEADLGVQIGVPFSPPGSPWTFNPFVQLTDVDRFGALGLFHFWQPYAQVGFQFSGPGNPQPVLTANLFPINLGLDMGEWLTLSLGAGLALTLDLQSGAVQAGAQVSSGLSVKFGSPTGPF